MRPRFGQTVSEALIQTIRYSWFALFCFDEKNSLTLSVTAQRGHYTCAVNIKDEFILLDDECQPRKVDIQFVQKNVRLLAIRTWEQQVILMPYKDTHKSNTVEFNVWLPVDLQFWPSSGGYDLQWHLSSILMPVMDSPTQKSYKRTPTSDIQ